MSDFDSAFDLLRKQDYASAETAFRDGLDIDPANAAGNYYYAECLMNRGDRTDVIEYLRRAIAFGGGSQEGSMAATALKSLAAQP